MILIGDAEESKSSKLEITVYGARILKCNANTKFSGNNRKIPKAKKYHGADHIITHSLHRSFLNCRSGFKPVRFASKAMLKNHSNRCKHQTRISLSQFCLP